MKAAIPPNGVTARCVSCKINRSSDNRAVISRGTGVSVAFDSIPLLSQILGCTPTAELRFSGSRKLGISLSMPLPAARSRYEVLRPVSVGARNERSESDSTPGQKLELERIRGTVGSFSQTGVPFEGDPVRQTTVVAALGRIQR